VAESMAAVLASVAAPTPAIELFRSDQVSTLPVDESATPKSAPAACGVQLFQDAVTCVVS